MKDVTEKQMFELYQACNNAVSAVLPTTLPTVFHVNNKKYQNRLTSLMTACQ